MSIDSLEIAAVSLSHYRSLAFNVVLFFFRELLLFLFMQFSRYTLVGSSGLEPPTSRLSGARSNQLSYEPSYGGDERVRTDGLLLARQALSQLSYTPVFGCDQLSRSTLQQSEDVLTPSKPYSAFDFLYASFSSSNLPFFRFTP